MKLRSFVPSLLGAAFGLFLSAQASAENTLRIATLAPKNSSWGKVFQVWEKAIDQKTSGKLKLEIYYNAVQGQEDGMVAKMKTGQLDGAVLTSVGLASIYREALVQQLPGVVTDWAKLDKVRAAVGADLEKGFDAAGFKVLGWGDIGLVRQFSKGFGIKGPNDVRGKRPVVWRNEPMGPIIYATIGNVVPVPLGPVEVLPALRSGQVNIVNAPALAAEQLQWAPNLDHVGTNVSVCAVGGTVFRKKALEDLPADVKKDFDDLQAKMAARDTHRIRKLDDEAFGRVSSKMTVVNLSEAEKAEWKEILDKSVKRIRQGTFDPGLVDRVIAAAK